MGYYVGKNFKSINKWILVASLLIIIGIGFGIKININYVHNEFSKYIEENYSNYDINISNITMDISKWKTTAIATSNKPYYSFYISKGITDNRIKDNYHEVNGKYENIYF